MSALIITGYQDPDLDGFACAWAYAELLKKEGTDCERVIFGTPEKEVFFVLAEYNIRYDQDAVFGDIAERDVILCDASTLGGFPDALDPTQVVEIIDHRMVHELSAFPRATAQIELVGAAATLVAEKWHASEGVMSTQSAALLYAAIVSNTINFQNRITTKRDTDMGEWLAKQCNPRKDFVRDMFLDKSDIERPIEELIPFAVEVSFDGVVAGIAQFELVGAEAFVHEKERAIFERLEELKKEKNLDSIMLTCIDLEKGHNIIVCYDDVLQKRIARTMHVSFENNLARTEEIFMRKEIVPILGK